MNPGETTLTPEKPRKFLGCGCSAWLLVGLIGFFLVSAGIGMGYLEAGWYLIAGWVSFLYRTLPRIAWNWDLIGLGVVCATGILLLTHQFLLWLVGSITVKREAEVYWPWRWTWCGIAALGVLFLVGMAVGGAAHQIGWMSSSEGRMMERKIPSPAKYEMRLLETGLAVALHEKEDLDGIRSLLWDENERLLGSERDTARLLQSYHVLLIAPSNRVEGFMIIPRDLTNYERLGGYVWHGDLRDRLSATNLQEKIKTLASQLRPL